MARKTASEETKRKDRERLRKWRKKNREYERAYHRARYAADPELRKRRLIASNKWRKKNRDYVVAKRREDRKKWSPARKLEMVEYRKRWHLTARLRAIEKLGGVCIKCGFSDSRALEFDHRKPLLRTKGRASSMCEILTLKNPAAVYDLLCANCHTIKTKENGEHWSVIPRKKRKK